MLPRLEIRCLFIYTLLSVLSHAFARNVSTQIPFTPTQTIRKLLSLSHVISQEEDSNGVANALT